MYGYNYILCFAQFHVSKGKERICEVCELSLHSSCNIVDVVFAKVFLCYY